MRPSSLTSNTCRSHSRRVQVDPPVKNPPRLTAYTTHAARRRPSYPLRALLCQAVRLSRNQQGSTASIFAIVRYADVGTSNRKIWEDRASHNQGSIVYRRCGSSERHSLLRPENHITATHVLSTPHQTVSSVLPRQ